jgi:hypothetical protein
VRTANSRTTGSGCAAGRRSRRGRRHLRRRRASRSRRARTSSTGPCRAPPPAPVERRRFADHIGGLASSTSRGDRSRYPRRSLDHGRRCGDEVVDRRAEVRRPEVGCPPRFGDDPGRAGTRRAPGCELEVGRRRGIERELGAPDGVVDASRLGAWVDRRFGLASRSAARRSPRPVEERLARCLRADAVDEDDARPPSDAAGGEPRTRPSWSRVCVGVWVCAASRQSVKTVGWSSPRRCMRRL